MTIQQNLIDGLLALDWVEGKRTADYRTFTHPTQVGTMFVGASGALRYSTLGKVGTCTPVPDKYRQKVLGATGLEAATG